MIITIDGPAASGKGTLARRLAAHLGLPFLDTGGLYRAVALRLLQAGENPADEVAALSAAQQILAADLQKPELRGEQVGQVASVVSAYPAVRAALLQFQRNFAANSQGAVLDGRDCGTVICPQADKKFFIIASAEARAKRRVAELEGRGEAANYEQILHDLQARDERDLGRSIAPLAPAVDAVTIDTSNLNADEVFEIVLVELEKA